jgi:hypothetical protein
MQQSYPAGWKAGGWLLKYNKAAEQNIMMTDEIIVD